MFGWYDYADEKMSCIRTNGELASQAIAMANLARETGSKMLPIFQAFCGDCSQWHVADSPMDAVDVRYGAPPVDPVGKVVADTFRPKEKRMPGTW